MFTAVIKPLARLTIFCIGILLTIGTFMALNDLAGLGSENDSFINLMYANCIGIGWGVWYYKLDIKTRQPIMTGDEI